MASETTKTQALLVFDFDWSLVNDNSDIYIFEQLAPRIVEEIKNEARASGSWTALIDSKVTKLLETTDVCIEDIAREMKGIPILDGMIDLIRQAKAHSTMINIVSDANEFFIESFLAGNCIQDCITEIHTNRSPMEQRSVGGKTKDILRVLPYELEPPQCSKCPPNMCKGKILDGMLANTAPAKIVYIGDGSGDYCAATKLRPNDILLVRKDSSYPRALGLSKRIKKYPKTVTAKIVYWKSVEEIATVLVENGFAPAATRM